MVGSHMVSTEVTYCGISPNIIAYINGINNSYLSHNSVESGSLENRQVILAKVGVGRSNRLARSIISSYIQVYIACRRQ